VHQLSSFSDLSNYHAMMSGGDKAKAMADSMLGNLSTKFFMQMADSVTNEFAAAMIGRTRQLMVSANTSHGPIEPFAAAFGARNTQTSAGVNEIFELKFQPSEFTNCALAARQITSSSIQFSFLMVRVSTPQAAVSAMYLLAKVIERTRS